MTVRTLKLSRPEFVAFLLLAACGPAPTVIGVQLNALEQLGTEAAGRHKSRCSTARPGAAVASDCPALLACLEGLSKAAGTCRHAMGLAAKGDDSYAQQAKPCTAQADAARGQCALTLPGKAIAHGS